MTEIPAGRASALPHATARTQSRRRTRFSTRRRLVVAFGSVLVAFIAALAVHLLGLRRMDATFDEMRDHEVELMTALRLEDAERDLYAYARRLVSGDAVDLSTYEAMRARVVDLDRELAARLDEPDAIEWLAEIRRTSAELDQTFRERIAPAARRGDPTAVVALDRLYPLVALIDRDVDRIIQRLQAASAECREALADLEERAARWTVTLLILAPIFTALVVMYLARSIAEPLARLSQGAAALAAGDLDARIQIDTPDEFGALATEFNAMTTALKQHQEQLVKSEKLAGIGRLAAGVAHELNNPLQVLLGYLSLDRDVPDARFGRHLAAMESEALRCKEIVERLLELARPAAEPQAIELRPICEEVTDRVRMSVRPGPPISVDGFAVALVDPAKLDQVLFNLVKNAAEAAGPEGAVSVGIGTADDAVEVAVRDSGGGIPLDARGQLFEPFFTTKRTGTGLGLAVSRAIARAHGGDIDARNGESGGAVFTLRLPKAPEARRGT